MERPSNKELIFSRMVLDRAAHFDTSYIQNADSLKSFVVPLASPLLVFIRNFGENHFSALSPFESDSMLERRIGNGVIVLTEEENTCMISKWHNREDYGLPENADIDENSPEMFYALTSNIISKTPPDIFISVPKTEDDGFASCIKKDEYEIIMPLMFPEDRNMSLTYVETLQLVLKDIISITE